MSTVEVRPTPTKTGTDGGKIRVLIVDDSALMRKLLTDILNSDPGIKVVATAADAYQARDKIKQLNPDVLTLDVEMPKMNGLDFLRNIMRLHPMPVVMISTLTQRGAAVTMDSLSIGAVEVVAKPQVDVERTLEACGAEIVAKVKIAAVARVQGMHNNAKELLSESPAKKAQAKANQAAASPLLKNKPADRIIAIGSSTGGTEAVKQILASLKPGSACVVIAQHIPAFISDSFAESLDRTSPLSVRLAVDGQTLHAGEALIAPGNRQMIVRRSGTQYLVKLSDGRESDKHVPSVDALFNSVAKAAGKRAVGAILTGMGRDGTDGMLAKKKAGALTIAQDEDSCVVFGMPRQAIESGAVQKVYPLSHIAGKLSLWAPK